MGWLNYNRIIYVWGKLKFLLQSMFYLVLGLLTTNNFLACRIFLCYASNIDTAPHAMQCLWRANTKSEKCSTLNEWLTQYVDHETQPDIHFIHFRVILDISASLVHAYGLTSCNCVKLAYSSLLILSQKVDVQVQTQCVTLPFFCNRQTQSSFARKLRTWTWNNFVSETSRIIYIWKLASGQV